MKKILFFLLLSTLVNAQKETASKLGQTTLEELKMAVYEKDSTAKAVVLYEHANVYIDEKNDYDFRRDVYKRIKILHKSALDRGTITISVYNKETVKYIKAITYNNDSKDHIKKIYLTDDKIFKKQVTDKWTEVSFTLPALKVGSVIEFTYSILSPYLRRRDWKFQSDIPKIKSDYTSAIPGNWKYNARLVGFKALDKDDVSIKKGCFYVPGIGNGPCLIRDYAMEHIPAFKEEDYMLSKENFISKLCLDLETATSVNGVKSNYTKTWQNAEKTLKKNWLDGQTSKKSFFKKTLPQHVFTIQNTLKKAETIYQHIQERLSWNTKFWTTKTRVKNIYDDKTGSVDGINLTLYNALQAADIESYIVMSSTRKNGLPTKLYPMVADFNYVLVKVVIDGKHYFLDATDKSLLFGEIPFRCLNGEGRVLDFKNGSYWDELKSRYRTISRVSTDLKFDANGTITGTISTTERGYTALKRRRLLQNKTKDEYLDSFETKYPDIEVNDFNIVSDSIKAINLALNYDIEIPDVIDDSKTLKFNPFVIDRTHKNPFKLNHRTYPVDFGHPKAYTHVININTPKGYAITKGIENKAISLPLKSGRFISKFNKTDTGATIFINIKINKRIYSSKEYHYLKEFYNQIIKTENSFIEYTKIN